MQAQSYMRRRKARELISLINKAKTLHPFGINKRDDPGLLKIRHSHRFVAVVIEILIPFSHYIALKTITISTYRLSQMFDFLTTEKINQRNG